MPAKARHGPVERQGLVDTNILILRHQLDSGELPAELAVSAVSLAELSAGVHLVRGDDAAAAQERARRVALLQQVENEFDPLPFDAATARAYGRICAAVAEAGRTPRSRVADLMIAGTAAVHGLPLFTTNPSDFLELQGLVEVVAVTRPRARPQA